jgi:hypothetical protein
MNLIEILGTMTVAFVIGLGFYMLYRRGKKNENKQNDM